MKIQIWMKLIVSNCDETNASDKLGLEAFLFAFIGGKGVSHEIISMYTQDLL